VAKSTFDLSARPRSGSASSCCCVYLRGRLHAAAGCTQQRVARSSGCRGERRRGPIGRSQHCRHACWGRAGGRAGRRAQGRATHRDCPTLFGCLLGADVGQLLFVCLLLRHLQGLVFCLPGGAGVDAVTGLLPAIRALDRFACLFRRGARTAAIRGRCGSAGGITRVVQAHTFSGAPPLFFPGVSGGGVVGAFSSWSPLSLSLLLEMTVLLEGSMRGRFPAAARRGRSRPVTPMPRTGCITPSVD
jgi:hypothetical protein